MTTRPLHPSEPVSEPAEDFDARALRMLHRLGGAGLVEEMTRIFAVQGPDRLAAARAGALAGDAEAVRASAHALKSSAGQLGATRLQRLCADLESAAMQSLANAGERLDTIEVELSRASRWLDQVVPTL